MKTGRNVKNNLLFYLKKYRHLVALAFIAALSFRLNFYAISKVGYGNAYYAAAIRSMTESFKNFFFVAFDPAGVVSVDKPPLALWIQAIFVLIFGYHGWAMLLPQALAGTGSCMMMYVLTAKHLGRPAGLISSLVFALTPAVVVASRNNTMDMQLIFALLVATWFLFKGLETSKWTYLFWAAFFIGLGFNIKMLQAYLILPGVGIVYLIFSREKFSRRILTSAVSLVIIAAVSFAWVAAVDRYPAVERPYVGSSTDNTVSELIVGHNGMERIYGQGGGNGGARGMGNFQNNGTDGRRDGNRRPGDGNNGTPPATQGGTNGGSVTNGTANRSGGNWAAQGAPGGFGRNGGQRQGGAAGNDIGTAGALRLWNSGMYGQASWLIVLALFGIAAASRKFSIRRPTLRQGVLWYWVLWLAVMAVFFSFASFFHRYYLCMLAPGIAGLAGIGISEMVRAFWKRDGWQQWLLPLSLLATSAVEIPYVWSYPDLRTGLVPVMAVSALAALILMAVHLFGRKRFVLTAAAACMLVSILAAPFYWSLTAVWYVPQNSTMPYAGPELASQDEVQGMTPNQETYVTADGETLALENYLVEHYRVGSYLVVAQRANDVAGLIIDTGLPAVAYGGFLGTDNALTLEHLKALVQEGKVTYFLVPAQSGFGGNSGSDLISYVKENATLVDPSEYGGSSGQTGGTVGLLGASLYCFDFQ